jgi:hypothetical protein
MAPTGSKIAAALGLMAMPAVVAGAFDDQLADAPSGAFVFRCLDGCDMEIGGVGPVSNRATHLAQMHTITRGKRLRNDLRRWANATVELRGGVLDNSKAHPDAGKIWSFGTYQQPLTDATVYSASAATLRLASGAKVASYTPGPGEVADLWVVSSAGPRTDVADPKRLPHVEVLFQYFADAETLVPTCAEAEGRITLATELPCATGASASRTVRASATMPPFVDLCAGGGWCEDCV